MPGTAGTIQGVFGWDNSPVIAGMAESERVVNRGASNIQNRLTGIFKRSPNMRAERAFSGLFQSLASGDIAGGIESVTNRMTGLGLVAGVAIGAGVAIFVKFKEQIDATREAHAALEMEMTKHPVSNVSRLSEEGMTSALNTRQKLLEDSSKKAEHTLGSELAEAGKSTLPFFFGKGEGKDRTDQQKLENKAGAEAKQIMADRAALAASLVNIEAARLQGYEREANISKIVLQAEQQRAALAGSGVSHAAYEKGEEAISRNAELQIKAEDDRAKMKERSLVVEEKMAKLIRQGLSAEDQRKVRAGLELETINKQLESEKSQPLRRGLLLQKAQKENELRAMAGPQDQGNPFNQGSLSARDWERQQDSMKFNSQFAGFGMSQQEQDRKGPAAPNAEVVTEVAKTNELLKQIFLKP